METKKIETIAGLRRRVETLRKEFHWSKGGYRRGKYFMGKVRGYYEALKIISEFEESVRARINKLNDKELEDVEAIWAYLYGDTSVGNERYFSFEKLIKDYKELKRILGGIKLTDGEIADAGTGLGEEKTGDER